MLDVSTNMHIDLYNQFWAVTVCIVVHVHNAVLENVTFTEIFTFAVDQSIPFYKSVPYEVTSSWT